MTSRENDSAVVVVIRSEPANLRPGVTIRILKASDAPLLHRWWNDPEVMRSVGFPEGLGISLEEIEETIAVAIAKDTPAVKHRRFIIESTNPARPIGEINYSRWDKDQRKVSMGIKLCEADAQRQGYATAAIHCFVRYLFEQLGVETIELDMRANNHPARRLYEKTGFKEIGIKKGGHFNQTTRAHEDVVLFSLSKTR